MASIRFSGEMSRDSTIKRADDSVFDGAYEIIAPVGRGRNSVVYKARRLRPPVAANEPQYLALKVLIGNTKNPELQVRRMKREALAMLSCIHPNIIKLIDYVAEADLCYLAMEFAERGDLKQVLEHQRTPFATDLALHLTSQVLAGLEKIHYVGLLHRDIKPENLLLTEECSIKIGDFGIACLPTEEVTIDEANRGIGTFDYLAPECLEEGVANQASDVYSAAVTCYQLLTCHLPFTGSSFTEQIGNKLETNVAPLKLYLADVPPLLQELLKKSLESDPERRFRTAGEFREAIDHFLAGKWEPEEEAVHRAPAAAEYPAAATEQDFQASGFEEEQPPEKQETFAAFWGEDAARKNPKLEEIKEKALACKERFKPILAQARIFADEFADISCSRLRRRGIFLSRAQFLYSALVIIAASVILFSSYAAFAARQQQQQPAPPAARSVQIEPSKSLAAVLPDLKSERAGVLYDFIAENQHMPFVMTPGANGKDIVMIVAFKGSQPKVLSLEELQSTGSIEFVGSGIRLELEIAGKDGDKLSGKYRDRISGRQGPLAIW